MTLKPTTILAAVLLFACRAPSQVAFVSDRGGEMDIYTFTADTSSLRRLSDPGGTEDGLVWAPDGSYLYFVSGRDSGQNIWRIRPDSTGLERVTSGPGAKTICDISPDGSRMMVDSKADNPEGDIYTMDIDGKKVRRITNNKLHEAGAAYSPDGKSIVVSLQLTAGEDGTSAGNADLFLLSVKGVERKQLTRTDDVFEGLPAFSPDGGLLAYHACSGGGCSIVVMDLATGKTLDLTKGDPDSRRPRWSPDGKWIAYTRTEKGNSDVWIVRPDGSGKRPFITSPGRDEIAVFGPKPVKMPEE